MNKLSKNLLRTRKSLTYKLLLPGLVILAVSGVGTYLISQSHADTASYTGFYNYSSVANLNKGVFTSSDVVGGIGTQTVADIQPKNKLVFSNFPGKVASSSTCYYLRVYNSPKAATQVKSAKIQVVGQGNSKIEIVPVDDNYHKVCALSGANTQLPYNVWNTSSSAYVLVYQAITDFKQ